MIKRTIYFTIFLFVFPSITHAVFPDDFSDVVWIDPDISGWAETAKLTVTVTDQHVILESDKKNVWPAAGNSILGNSNTCCNANAWVFAKFGETWYAVTWEWLRKGQSAKNRSAFEGGHTRRPPFFGGGYPTWTPQNGEIYGLMVSGFARFGVRANIRERSNVAFYRWGEGMVDPSELSPANTTALPAINLLLSD